MSGWWQHSPFVVIPGALLPPLGLWIVLQRVVFLGVTLAQVAAAGVALGLLLHPERASRLVELHARDADQQSLLEVVDAGRTPVHPDLA